MAGDTVIVRFVEADSAGTKKTKVQQLEAMDSARSFYRAVDKGKAADSTRKPPSLNYARADRIVVRMATSGDGGMERVDLFGHVDGIQLEPGKATPAAKAARGRGAQCHAGRAGGAGHASRRGDSAVAPKPSP